MSAQSSFAALRKKARKQRHVIDGLARNSPNLRNAVQRQIERFQHARGFCDGSGATEFSAI